MYPNYSKISKGVPYTDTSWYLYLQKDEIGFGSAVLGIANVNMYVLQVNNANTQTLDLWFLSLVGSPYLLTRFYVYRIQWDSR